MFAYIIIKLFANFCFSISIYLIITFTRNIINKRFSLGRSKEKIHFKTLKVKHGQTKSLIYIFLKTAYISDSNDLSITNKKELKNLRYLILDCLNLKKHPTHFNLKEALFIHSQLKPKKTILTNLHQDLE